MIKIYLTETRMNREDWVCPRVRLLTLHIPLVRKALAVDGLSPCYYIEVIIVLVSYAAIHWSRTLNP